MNRVSVSSKLPLAVNAWSTLSKGTSASLSPLKSSAIVRLTAGPWPAGGGAAGELIVSRPGFDAGEVGMRDGKIKLHERLLVFVLQQGDGRGRASECEVEGIGYG